MKPDSRSSSSTSTSSGNEQGYKRIKFDSSSEPEGSSSSIEVIPMHTNMKTQAAFINKLYKMLEDPDISELISWSKLGDLFSVSNPTAFSKTVLPQYFKHNNWPSFVRQLNMYGFHKVNDLIHSNLTNESQTWEFKHPNFRRGAVNDLQHIKRKSPKSQQLLKQQQQQQTEQQQTQQLEQQQMYTDEPNENETVIKYILRIESNLADVSKSCEQLFNEVVHLRMVVSKQQDAMQDLVDVVSSLPKSDCCRCNTQKNQDLQNAENLRIQVSKLKSSQNNNTNWNYEQKKLPSFDSIQYNNTNDRESCSFSSTSSYNSNSGQNKTLSYTMGFGKESHMLNPTEDSLTSRQNSTIYK